MRTRDAFVLAIENLAEHKLRSGLTMLGMMFGVGAVIAMLSIGAGAERQAMSLIEKLGLRNVLVRAKTFKPDELAEIRKKSLGVSLRDVEAIEEAVPNIELVASRVEIDPYKILTATGKTEANVFGVSRHHADLVSLVLEEGRFVDRLDEKTHAQVCVIGSAVRRDLFGADTALGEPVKINDVWFEVIGVLAAESLGGDSFEGVSIGSTTNEIYVPASTALRKFERDPMKSPLSEILIRLDKDATSYESAAIIRGLLDRLHAGVDDFEIVVPEALLRQSQETQRLFNLVMGCIAGIALLVGGIGIMNIMLASVLEQTREIGVRRAVGARKQDIRFQFLVAAFSMSFLGGIAGIMLGLAISGIIAAYAGWPTVVTIASIALSTGVSASVGVVSGMYPALRAANLDPIEALRYE